MFKAFYYRFRNRKEEKKGCTILNLSGGGEDKGTGQPEDKPKNDSAIKITKDDSSVMTQENEGGECRSAVQKVSVAVGKGE